MKDGKTYVSISTDPVSHEYFVARNNYSDGKIVERLFSEEELVFQGIQLQVGTEFSPDERKVMLVYQEEPIYRRSSKGYYYVFDLDRSEEHTSELQSLMRITYTVFCLKQKK